MSSIQKFMFDNAIFDPPLEPIEEVSKQAEEAAEPETPPPPGVTFEELARARAEAYEQGLTDGKHDVEARAHDAVAHALQHVAKVSDYLLRHDDQQRQQIERQVLEGTMAMTKRLFPVLAEKGNLERLSQFARQTLNDHADEREILIAVPVGSAAPLKNDLKAVLESRGMTDRVKVVEDQGLAVTDCRITWANGGANMLIDRIWQAIETASQQAMAAHGLAPTDGQDYGDTGTESASTLPEPGPAPVPFTPLEATENPSKPDFSQLPDWLAQAIADEPSHVIRELGPMPTEALAESEQPTHSTSDADGVPLAPSAEAEIAMQQAIADDPAVTNDTRQMAAASADEAETNSEAAAPPPNETDDNMVADAPSSEAEEPKEGGA